MSFPQSSSARREAMKMSGAAMYGRLVVLEAIIVALGAAGLQGRSPDDRKAYIAELKRDALVRAHDSGHDEANKEADAYADEIFGAMLTASEN